MDEIKDEYLAGNKIVTPKYIKPLFIVFTFISLLMGLMIWPLEILESGFTWLIFYPAVIISALYAGFYAGLLATVLVCLVVLFIFPLLGSSFLTVSQFGFLDIAIFAATSTFIAYYIEAMHLTFKSLQQAQSISKNHFENEQFIRSIIENTPNMMGYWDKDLRCRYANTAFTQWFNIQHEKIIGIKFLDLVGDALYALNEPYIHAVLAGEPQKFERKLYKTDGSIGHIIGHYIPDFDNHGMVKGFAIQASEVTIFKETEQKLKLAACVFDNTLDGVLITDIHGAILSVNPAFVEITGYSQEEVIGKNPRILQSNRHGPEFYSDMWKEIKENGLWKGEVWNRHKSGEDYLQRMTVSMVRRDVDDEPMRYVSVFSDITELWRKDEYIKHLAFHDPLTNLPNRTLLMERLNQKLLSSERECCDLAVMFLDLDGFKIINDQYGHNIGDELLKNISSRLLVQVRKSDTVARVGGDEFIFILNKPQNKDDIIYVGNRIINAISEPIDIMGETFNIGISIGVAQYPTNGNTAVELIRNADIAMYNAKNLGRNTIQFYSS